MNKKKLILISIMLVFISIISIFYFYKTSQTISTDDATINGKTVTLMPKINGYITKINVTDNQEVHAGDVIMEIDSSDYYLKVQNAEKALSEANSKLASAENDLQITSIVAPANQKEAQEKIKGAQAVWEKDNLNLQRMKILMNENVCSQEEFDKFVSTERSSRALLEEMKANFKASNTVYDTISKSKNNLQALKDNVAMAKIMLKQANKDLKATKIIAPINGKIAKKNVEVGSYVQAGSMLCSIVSSDLWVIANFKENKLSKLERGDKVKISIDAFPTLELNGHIDSFQAGTGTYFSLFPAENATGNFVKTVQRLPVKIVFDNIPLHYMKILAPGMSVTPTVYIKNVNKS